MSLLLLGCVFFFFLHTLVTMLTGGPASLMGFHPACAQHRQMKAKISHPLEWLQLKKTKKTPITPNTDEDENNWKSRFAGGKVKWYNQFGKRAVSSNYTSNPMTQQLQSQMFTQERQKHRSPVRLVHKRSSQLYF